MAGRFGGATAAAIAAVVAASFGGGFLTARVLPPHAAAVEGKAESGFQWPFFGKPRAANAPRPGEKKPAGFAVWKTRTDTSKADPLACIQLTRPLDSERAYGDFVQVSPAMDHPPAVSAKGDELCVAGGGFYGHRITLLKGLPAKSGETLAANADVDFTFGDKPPYVGFQGEGVILPRDESDGLGIETVNVAKLALEVWRVPDRNLVKKEIGAPDPTDEGGYADDYGESAPDDAGRVVWKGDMAVHGRQGERAVTVFPLGAVLKDLKPGAYVIKAKDSSGARGIEAKGAEDESRPAQARRWVIYTDMGLIAYDGSEALDVTVRSLKTAKIMAGVRIALVAKDGEDLAAAQSDGSGRVRFPHSLLNGDGAAKAKMVMAYGPDADFTALDLERSPVDLSKANAGGREEKPTGGRESKTAVDGFLYADRGIYRPGETVHLVGLVRDKQARALKDRKGALVIKRPSGVEYRRIRFDHAEGGSVTQDVVLPKTAPRGRWRASLEMEGIDDAAGEVSFSVEDFAPQRLAVDVHADQTRPIIAGEVRKIEVDARFLYGATGAGLQTEGEARLRPDPEPFPQFKDYRWGDEQHPFQEKLVEFGKTVTDGAGHAIQSFDAAKEAGDAGQPLAAAYVASVFEPGGRPVRESATLKVRTRPLYLGVKPTSTGTGETIVQTFDIVAADASGARVAADGVGWTLIAEKWDYNWFQKDGKWAWRRTSRDATLAKGVLTLSAAGDPARLVRRLPWGDYRLELNEPKTGARTVLKLATGWGEPAKGEEAPDSVRVSAGPKTYAQGDTVEVTLKAPYAGEAQVAVATDRLIDFKTVSVGKDGATVRLKSTAEWGGGAYVLVSVIQPRDPAVTPKPRRALGLIYVPLEPKGRKLTVAITTQPKLDSRQPVKVPLQVQGLKFGTKAHVTLAAVDEGILRLTHQDNPDPVKWYFGKRALTLDYRDDYGRLLDPNLGAAAAVNYGGDEVGGAGLTTTPIKTVALWSGVVDTDGSGHATVILPAQPDFNGQLRLVAVAWNDDQVGSGWSDEIVRAPVVAELSLPRFLAPGDQAFATLELHNVEARAGRYLAEVFGDHGLLAPFRKLYQLLLGTRMMERTPLNAPTVAGVGAVTLKVSGPGYSTQKSWPLETRLGWGPVTRATIELQKAGESYTPPPALLSGLAAGTLSMTVSYSPFRGFDPATVAEALSRYPYGCTEQLVSAAYPLLYATEVSPDPKLRRVPTKLVEAATALLDRQTLDGAFGLWKPGDKEADAWLGAYAVDFLLSARGQGVPVGEDALNRAIAAMRAISRPEGFVSVAYLTEYPAPEFATPADAKVASTRLRTRASAYALYDLAKAGQGDLARLRWFHDVQMKDEPSPLARAQVGAGLAMMGDRARAHDSFVQAVRVLGYKEPRDWYQSELRDLAGVVSLAYEAGELGIARQLQGRLEGTMRDPDKLNTQEQAQLLKAAHAMLKASGSVSVQASGAQPLSGSARWAVGKLADARFVNTGRGAAWRTVTVRGVPTAAPASSASGMTVAKAFYTLQGGGADPASLAQGARVVVRLSGRSEQGQSMMAVIDDALPAGWEVETVLSPDDAKTGPFKFLGELTSVSVQEKRDDRYIAAMTLQGNKPYAVAYIARAITPGDFLLPGAEARDMYHASVSARSAAGRTKIAAGP